MNFGEKAFAARNVVAAAIIAAGMSASAHAQDLMEMAGMEDVSVGGYVLMTNDLDWRGMTTTNRNFGLLAGISISSGPVYFLLDAQNTGTIPGADAYFVASGGWGDSFAGVGYDVGMSYYYATGDDSLHRNGDRASFLELYASASYDLPYGVGVRAGMAFDMYHNGQAGGYCSVQDGCAYDVDTDLFDMDHADWVPAYVDASGVRIADADDVACEAANAITANSCSANSGGSFWSGHIFGEVSYAATDELNLGAVIGYHPLSFVVGHGGSEYSFVYGTVYANYDIGHGLTASLRWYMNSINNDIDATLSTGSAGNFAFQLTKSF